MALKAQLVLWDPDLGQVILNAAQIAAILSGTAQPLTVAALTSAAIAATGTISATGNITGANDTPTGDVIPGGALVETVATGIVAGTTHTLVGATALTKTNNVVTTVANASDAVALPLANAAMVGKTVKVFNDGTHVAAVWPQAADNIDGAGAGVAVALTNAHRCAYLCTAVGVWESYQLGVVSA